MIKRILFCVLIASLLLCSMTLNVFAEEPAENQEVATVEEQQEIEEGEEDESDFSDLFTIETLYRVVDWILTSGVLAFLIKLIASKAKDNIKLDGIVGKVTTAVSNMNTDAVNDTLKNVIGPVYEKVEGSINGIEETIKVLARCMLLMQENTPESRLAIAKELSELNDKKDGLSEEVKKLIEGEIAKNIAKKEENEAALAEIEAANDSIEVVSKQETNGRV